MNKSITLNDNCLNTMRGILSNSVSAIITDPPYGGVVPTKWDVTDDLRAIWEEAFRIMKPGAYLVVFGDHKRFHHTIVELESVGFQLISGMGWEYPNGTPACQKIDDLHHARVKPGHEPFGLFIKPILEKTYKKQREIHGNSGLRVKNTVPGVSMTSTILQYNKPTPTERDLGVEHFPKQRVYDRQESDRSLHKTVYRKNHGPCVKPIALMSHLCNLIASPGDTILDPFMGTGATGMAAIWSGMNFIGVEQDKSYYEMAKSRIEYALNNSAPIFPLKAAMRRKIAKTEKSFSNPASHTTPWIYSDDDLRALLPLRRPIRIKRAIQKLLSSAATILSNAFNSIKGKPNNSRVSGRWDTKKTAPITGITPNGQALPLHILPFVEMLPQAFHNKNWAICQHRDRVWVEFFANHFPSKMQKIIIIGIHHIPAKKRGHSYFYGLGYECYRTWLEYTGRLWKHSVRHSEDHSPLWHGISQLSLMNVISTPALSLILIGIGLFAAQNQNPLLSLISHAPNHTVRRGPPRARRPKDPKVEEISWVRRRLNQS